MELVQYLTSVSCTSLFTRKHAWLSWPCLCPTAPVLLLTNPYNYVGHKGLDLAAGPKWGWAALGGASMEISVVFVRTQISDKSKQLPPSPPSEPSPLPRHHNPHDLWPVITFILKMQPDQELSVSWCGAEACACTRGHCWKTADSLDWISFDRQKYWQM